MLYFCLLPFAALIIPQAMCTLCCWADVAVRVGIGSHGTVAHAAGGLQDRAGGVDARWIRPSNQLTVFL